MAWDNTSNFSTGKVTMEQYNQALDPLGVLSTSADQSYWNASNETAKNVQALYNQILEQAGGSKSIADKIFEKQYGYKIDKFYDMLKQGSQQHVQDRTNEVYNRGQQKLKEVQAREATIANREAAAKQAQTQARTQGMSKGLASSIGNAPLSGQQSANYGNNLGALKNLGQTTQNDYLQKMGYANALQQQAENMEKGSKLNVIGSAIGGAGSGASVGASLFGGMGKGD